MSAGNRRCFWDRLRAAALTMRGRPVMRLRIPLAPIMQISTQTPTTPAAGGNRPLARLAARLRALVEPGRCEPIGLEIAAERINMVQFDTVAARPVIRAAISVPYADGREALLAEPGRLKALVARAFAQRPFSGRRVVSCLPAAEVNIITLSYQRAAGEDDANAILRELRERLKNELERSVVDYITI